MILVGHGGVPSDCPPGSSATSSARRRLPKDRPSPGLAAADAELRAWPRTDSTDPYGAGLRSLLAALKAQLPGHEVVEAYNEFCPRPWSKRWRPSSAAAPRGDRPLHDVHPRRPAQREGDPRAARAERLRHAGVVIRYVWPYSLEAVSGMLAQEVLRTEK